LFVPQEACFLAERNSFFLWYSSSGIPFCLQNVNKTLFSVFEFVGLPENKQLKEKMQCGSI
jgi:hypothetical protein